MLQNGRFQFKKILGGKYKIVLWKKLQYDLVDKLLGKIRELSLA